MKRSTCLVFLAFLFLFSSVSFAEPANFPALDDVTLVDNYYKYLDTNGVITVSQDFEIESNDNEDGSKIVTVNYSPSNGFDFSITYTDGHLTSYLLSLDPSNAYVKSKATEMMLCFQMAFSGYNAEKSLAVLVYLIQNIEPDPLFGKVCEVNKDGFIFKFTVTPINTMMLVIYPPEK